METNFLMTSITLTLIMHIQFKLNQICLNLATLTGSLLPNSEIKDFDDFLESRKATCCRVLNCQKSLFFATLFLLTRIAIEFV